MTLTISTNAPVFTGKEGAVGTIPKGKYEVSVILPPKSGEDLTWYQIANTKKTIGFNPNNLTTGVVLEEG